MSKWIGPSAYFGAYFGAGEPSAPGAMLAQLQGVGSLFGELGTAGHGSLSDLALTIVGSGSLSGALAAGGSAQVVDLSATMFGSGSLSGTLAGTSLVTWAPPIIAPYRRPRTFVGLAMVAQGHAELSAGLEAAAGARLVVTAESSLSGALGSTLGDDVEALLLALSLAA